MSRSLLKIMKVSVPIVGAAAFLVATPGPNRVTAAYAQSAARSGSTGSAKMQAPRGPRVTTKPSADSKLNSTTGGQTFIVQQADNDVGAKQLIGHAITNGQGKTIGNVNDLIFAQKGDLKAVVIGVGGFLGIGEKDVAVPYATISLRKDPKTGDLKLTMNMSQNELKSAPAFVTTQQKLAQQRAKEQAARLPAKTATSLGAQDQPPSKQQ